MDVQCDDKRVDVLISTSKNKSSLDPEIWPFEDHVLAPSVTDSIWGGSMPLGFPCSQITEDIEIENISYQSQFNIEKESFSNNDFSHSTFDSPNTHTKFYVEWIEALIALKGGKISEDDLQKDMELSNQALFNSIKDEFGSVIGLLVRFPAKFELSGTHSSGWNISSLNESSNFHRPKYQAYELQVEPSPDPKTDEEESVDEVINESAAEILDTKNFNSRMRKVRSTSSTIDEKMVDKVIECSTEILQEASGMSLKAVELANTLRARLGTPVLAHIREYFGGLLSLLEKYPDTFEVQRIPKSDLVKLKIQDHLGNSVLLLQNQLGQRKLMNSYPKKSFTNLTPSCRKGVLRATAPEFVLHSPTTPPCPGQLNPLFSLNHVSDLNRNNDKMDPYQYHTSIRHPHTEHQREDCTTYFCPALEILTSEKCVPTKAWEADICRDRPFLEIIQDLLQQAGGSMTVSKLRGLVRMRINSTDTVKSVPLKALLRAYSMRFMVKGNQVSLLSSSFPQASKW